MDPALVHHYFADKAALFVETMGLPVDPREVKDEVERGGVQRGAARRALSRPVGDGSGSGSPAFVSLVQAMAASPEVAENMRQFVAERVGLHGAAG